MQRRAFPASRRRANRRLSSRRGNGSTVSPSNCLQTNPVVIEATLREGGQNLLRGLQHWTEDVQALIAGKAPAHAEAFELGRDIAATPGQSSIATA